MASSTLRSPQGQAGSPVAGLRTRPSSRTCVTPPCCMCSGCRGGVGRNSQSAWHICAFENRPANAVWRIPPVPTRVRGGLHPAAACTAFVIVPSPLVGDGFRPNIRVNMQKDRLNAFSDGVVAIIITIMVLELKVPHEADGTALL